MFQGIFTSMSNSSGYNDALKKDHVNTNIQYDLIKKQKTKKNVFAQRKENTGTSVIVISALWN